MLTQGGVYGVVVLGWGLVIGGAKIRLIVAGYWSVEMWSLVSCMGF